MSNNALNLSTSKQLAKTLATTAHKYVALRGTCVFGSTTIKDDGNNPSRAMAKYILDWEYNPCVFLTRVFYR